MSAKERLRLEVLAGVANRSTSLSDAAAKLGLSYRQTRRVRRRHVDDGNGGLVHRLRGRAPNRKTPAAVRARVPALCREQYAGFGPTLLGEHLLNLDEPGSLSHDTVRRWLLAEGLMPRRRRRGKRRSRRERRSRPGELVRMDGSRHDWFEGRGPWCRRMVTIDDASGRVPARFYEKGTPAAALGVFGRYAARYGLPVSLYVGRAGIHRSDKAPTPQQELAGERPPTQFGRATNGLDVELILAEQPPGQRPRRTVQRHAAGPAGEGDEAGGGRRHPVGQPVARRVVPGVVRRTVRGDAGRGGRRAPGGSGRVGRGAVRAPRAAGGTGLVRAVAWHAAAGRPAARGVVPARQDRDAASVARRRRRGAGDVAGTTAVVARPDPTPPAGQARADDREQQAMDAAGRPPVEAGPCRGKTTRGQFYCVNRGDSSLALRQTTDDRPSSRHVSPLPCPARAKGRPGTFVHVASSRMNDGAPGGARRPSAGDGETYLAEVPTVRQLRVGTPGN